MPKLREIVGETLDQAGGFDPDTASAIPDLRRFYEDRITHGYNSVDDAIVWQRDGADPPMVAVLEDLLKQAPPMLEVDGPNHEP